MAHKSKKQKVEQPTPPGLELLNEPQCATLLGVKIRTVRLWRAKRGLPHIKITSREIRYRPADITAWLEQRRVAIAA